MPQPKVIILGAGFAGIRAALDLCRINRFEITLVNNSPYHCFHPDLYETATAIIGKEAKTDFNNLKGTVSIPLQKIFKNKKVKIVIDKAQSADLRSRVVALQKSGNLSFDFLVLSLGSTTNFFDIPGAEENGHPLKSAENALNIRNDIDELIVKNNKGIKIVIAGGGFTGVEFSAELAGFLSKLSKLHQKEIGTIKLIESSQNVLSDMPSWAQNTANTRLKKLGIELLLNHKIKKVEKNIIYFKDSQKINYDYLIWATGVKGASSSTPIKGVELNQKGQIKVSPDLNVLDCAGVFSAGDTAEWTSPEGTSVPLTAWVAIGQGKTVAKNIINNYFGKSTINYTPPATTFIVPLGKKTAISNIANLKLTGTHIWALRRLISLKYLFSILPFREALTIWWHGVRIYVEND